MFHLASLCGLLLYVNQALPLLLHLAACVCTWTKKMLLCLLSLCVESSCCDATLLYSSCCDAALLCFTWLLNNGAKLPLWESHCWACDLYFCALVTMVPCENLLRLWPWYLVRISLCLQLDLYLLMFCLCAISLCICTWANGLLIGDDDWFYKNRMAWQSDIFITLQPSYPSLTYFLS